MIKQFREFLMKTIGLKRPVMTKTTNLTVSGVIAAAMALCIAMSVYFAVPKNTVVESTKFSSTSTSYFSYNVDLLKNSFYKDKTIPANLVYVESIVEKVNANFNYTYTTSVPAETVYSYKVEYSLMAISNDSTPELERVLWHSEKVLLETEETEAEEKYFNIEIPFEYSPREFSNTLRKFSEDLRVSFNARVDFTLTVDVVSTIAGEKPIKTKHIHRFSQPVMRDTFFITGEDAVKTPQEIKEENVVTTPPVYALTVVFAFAALLMLAALLAFRSLVVTFEGDPYENEVNRLISLVEDRLVFIATPKYDMKDNILLHDFASMMKLSDECATPIICYRSEGEPKSTVFFIVEDYRMYFYLVSAGDFDSKEQALQKAYDGVSDEDDDYDFDDDDDEEEGDDNDDGFYDTDRKKGRTLSIGSKTEEEDDESEDDEPEDD
ncbi:MAG: DUF5305 domain-containing protein [Oscillospiraceae bacterium]|jgi:hypothetical protein|nr:DUF5305 domain-containing protein [Oscillospiraceae bacterium]